MTLAHPLGIQLYSGRKFPPVETQLATIARHGFTNVETFAPFYDDVSATKRMLDAHGLSAKSGHFSVAMLEDAKANGWSILRDGWASRSSSRPI